MSRSKPKKPKKTAQEKAMVKRQTLLLDKEIAEQEKRLKSMARGKLGAKSLLRGAPMAAKSPQTENRMV